MTELSVFTRRNLLRHGLVAAAIASPVRRVLGRTRGPDIGVNYHNPAGYTVEHQLQLTNGSSTLSAVEIWLPLPQEFPEQGVEMIELRPRVRVYEDATGSARVARIHETRNLPREGESIGIGAKYRVTSLEVSTEHDWVRQQPFGAYRSDQVYRLFTRSEKKIETQDSLIRQQAAALKAVSPTPYAFAKAAYDWILDRTRYRRVDGLQGARFCLHQQSGECGDYSALFVALCRAAGVPSRPVVGFWANQSNGWHVWAEFMCPGGEWIPVDGTLGAQSEANRQYYFGSLDNQRVALSKTFDVRLGDVRAGKSEVEFLQVGAHWWYASRIGRRPQFTYNVEGQASCIGSGLRGNARPNGSDPVALVEESHQREPRQNRLVHRFR